MITAADRGQQGRHKGEPSRTDSAGRPTATSGICRGERQSAWLAQSCPAPCPAWGQGCLLTTGRVGWALVSAGGEAEPFSTARGLDVCRLLLARFVLIEARP